MVKIRELKGKLRNTTVVVEWVGDISSIAEEGVHDFLDSFSYLYRNNAKYAHWVVNPSPANVREADSEEVYIHLLIMKAGWLGALEISAKADAEFDDEYLIVEVGDLRFDKYRTQVHESRWAPPEIREEITELLLSQGKDPHFVYVGNKTLVDSAIENITYEYGNKVLKKNLSKLASALLKSGLLDPTEELSEGQTKRFLKGIDSWLSWDANLSRIDIEKYL